MSGLEVEMISGDRLVIPRVGSGADSVFGRVTSRFGCVARAGPSVERAASGGLPVVGLAYGAGVRQVAVHAAEGADKEAWRGWAFGAAVSEARTCRALDSFDVATKCGLGTHGKGAWGLNGVDS